MHRRFLGVLFLGVLIGGHAAELVGPLLDHSQARCVCNQRVCICAHRRKAAHHDGTAGLKPAGSTSRTLPSGPSCHSKRTAPIPSYSVQSCDRDEQQATAGCLYLLPSPFAGFMLALQREPIPALACRFSGHTAEINPPPPQNPSA